jgi:hypothetical protein
VAAILRSALASWITPATGLVRKIADPKAQKRLFLHDSDGDELRELLGDLVKRIKGGKP